MAIYHEDIADIELSSGSIHRSFLNHSIGSGDAEANRFGVRVMRNGEDVDLTGVSCFGYFRNAEGTNIALTSEGTVSGNVAYVTLPQACYNVEGQFALSIKLVGGGVTGTMRIVDGVVDNTNTGSAVAPTEDVPTYTEILAVYDQMLEAVEDYDETVAEQNAKIDGFESALNITQRGFTDNKGNENAIAEQLSKNTNEPEKFEYGYDHIDWEHRNGYVTGNIGSTPVFNSATTHSILKISNPWIAKIILPVYANAVIDTIIIVDNDTGKIIGKAQPSASVEVTTEIEYSFRSHNTIYINWWYANGDQTLTPQYCYIAYEDPTEYNFLMNKTPYISDASLFGNYGAERTYLYANCIVFPGWVSKTNDGKAVINDATAGYYATHKHIIIQSRNVKTITINGEDTPGASYGFWFENPIDGGRSVSLGAVASPSYRFNEPTPGYLYINVFGDDQSHIYAKSFTVTYWTADELYGNQPSKRYYHSVRKPFVFNGKTAVFTGDSITKGFINGTTITENGYPKLFSEAVGMTFTNAGVGGATLARVTGYGSIQDQIASASRDIDFLFVAGGVNDWQLGVSLSDFTDAVETICNYINSNYDSSVKVIWITPVNHGGWDVRMNINAAAPLQDYRNIITRIVTENDTMARFSIVQGDQFNFPTADDDAVYIAAAYGDQLHPTENGYKNIYVPGLMNALN